VGLSLSLSLSDERTGLSFARVTVSSNKSVVSMYSTIYILRVIFRTFHVINAFSSLRHKGCKLTRYVNVLCDYYYICLIVFTICLITTISLIVFYCFGYVLLYVYCIEYVLLYVCVLLYCVVYVLLYCVVQRYSVTLSFCLY
jgi:hypothetical protein